MCDCMCMHTTYGIHIHVLNASGILCVTGCSVRLWLFAFLCEVWYFIPEFLVVCDQHGGESRPSEVPEIMTSDLAMKS